MVTQALCSMIAAPSGRGPATLTDPARPLRGEATADGACALRLRGPDCPTSGGDVKTCPEDNVATVRFECRARGLDDTPLAQLSAALAATDDAKLLSLALGDGALYSAEPADAPAPTLRVADGECLVTIQLPAPALTSIAGASAELPGFPDPIAIVGDRPIPLSAFRAIYERKLEKYRVRDRQMPMTADRRYRRSLTERLIYQEVLRQEAAALGIHDDAAAIAKREQQSRRGIRDWARHLERRGETDQSLRDLYTAELRERAMLEQSGALDVSESELDAEYEKVRPNYVSDKPRVRAAHILIRVGPPPSTSRAPTESSAQDKARWRAEALTRARELRELATRPDADFAALAREHSSGPSAGKGGDLGIFTRDRMVTEFSDAAFKLKVGQVSRPVETKFGVHIIKLLGRYGPGELPRAALEDQLRERLQSRKLHAARRELKERLLAKYNVQTRLVVAERVDRETGERRDPEALDPRARELATARELARRAIEALAHARAQPGN